MGEASKAGDQASATTLVEFATSSTRSGCSTGSSTSRPHRNGSSHNSRPHGNSSSSGSGNIRSHSSGDRGISSSTPGPAERDHLLISRSTPGPAGRNRLPNSSTGAERPTSGDIGAEISRTGNDTCVSGAARRSIYPQSGGQLRPHKRHWIVHMWHHHFQELMRRSTAPSLLPPGHRTTAMDIRPRPATDLGRHTTAYLPRRCHDHPDLTDHLHRHLPQNPTGASRPGNPRLYGHITCLQASFRVRIEMTGVQKMVV